MLMSKIYVLVNSDMKNVIGNSDPNVMFKGPGPELMLKRIIMYVCTNPHLVTELQILKAKVKFIATC